MNYEKSELVNVVIDYATEKYLDYKHLYNELTTLSKWCEEVKKQIEKGDQNE